MDKYFDLAKELKKLWNMKVTIIPTVIDHQNNYITEIGQNTEESPGDLMRFVVTQTLVRNHQLTLV